MNDLDQPVSDRTRLPLILIVVIAGAGFVVTLAMRQPLPWYGAATGWLGQLILALAVLRGRRPR